MSSEDWALVERYLPDAALIAKKASAAHEHFHHRIPENHRRETIQKVVDAFWKQYGSPDLKYQAAYELARRGQTDDFLPMPFRLLGYMGPDWDEGGMGLPLTEIALQSPILCCVIGRAKGQRSTGVMLRKIPMCWRKMHMKISGGFSNNFNLCPAALSP